MVLIAVSVRSIEYEIPQTLYKQLGTSAFSPAGCFMGIYPFLSVHSLIDKKPRNPSISNSDEQRDSTGVNC